MLKFLLQWLSGGLSYKKYPLISKLEVLGLGLGNHRLAKSCTSLDKVGKSNNDLSIFGENNLMLPRPYKSSTTYPQVSIKRATSLNSIQYCQAS